MNINRIARVASLIGEPARTAMLVELMDGRALTANELARIARVTPQTASRHLALLVESGLLRVNPAGRHRYHSLASAEVARMLEEIMQVAARSADTERVRVVVGPKDAALRLARSCYDHLAGRLGVAITDRLLEDRAIVIEGESGYVTDKGRATLTRLGIACADLATPHASSIRPQCRPCLDWSERRMHVAGALGALICAHCLEAKWVTRRPGTRALGITPKGRMALEPWLGASAWNAVTG